MSRACDVLCGVAATMNASKASVPVHRCTSVSVTLAGRRWIALWTADVTTTARVYMALISVMSVFTARRAHHVISAHLAATAVLRRQFSVLRLLGVMLLSVSLMCDICFALLALSCYLSVICCMCHTTVCV